MGQKYEVDCGAREGVTSGERERIKALEREVKELRCANEILKLACAFSPRLQHRAANTSPNRTRQPAYGFEPICSVLQVAPSGYRRHAAQQRTPELLCARAKQGPTLLPQIHQVWQNNMQAYCADNNIWHQLNREGVAVARCAIERLMRQAGLRGVRRGKMVRTTIGDKAVPCPLYRVDPQFKADRPSQLWVSDFTYVSTRQGWEYVAFVVDVFARRIAGWHMSSSMRTDFVLDALEQALYASQNNL